MTKVVDGDVLSDAEGTHRQNYSYRRDGPSEERQQRRPPAISALKGLTGGP